MSSKRSKRPTRAAAVAASAGISRQVADEENSSLGFCTKKRPTSTTPQPSAKKLRMSTSKSKKLEMKTLTFTGKKRRQAAVYEVSSEVKNDETPQKTKINHSLQQIDRHEGRSCDFCRKVANVCALMHCTACRRVYHAKCFMNAFKPFIDENTPIMDQIERLRVEAPERRGNIFRCNSCKAAFVDFYEGGGFLWDCNCPTCLQPEKLVSYRQQKLLQMINDVELEKQQKQAQKFQVSKAKQSNTGKRMTSRLIAATRSRITRESSATPDEKVSEMLVKRQSLRSYSESAVCQDLRRKSGAKTPEAMEIDTVDLNNEGKTTEKPHKPDVMDVSVLQKSLEDVAKQGVAAPRQLSTLQVDGDSLAPQNELVKQATRIHFDSVVEPEQLNLSGDELVHAVQVQHDDKTNSWNFPLMCSRSSNLRESGVMKSGKCIWSIKKMARVQCGCCNKQLNYSEFVHHTDNSLVKDVKSANEDPMLYLFVEHRDIMQHTPLDQYLPDFRAWAVRQSLNNASGKSCKNSLLQGKFPVITTTNPKDTTAPPETDTLSRLALFKSPKHRSSKTIDADFTVLARVVCLSPKYVMKMTDGSFVDRVIRSQTPLPSGAFPRKMGWLAVSHKMPRIARFITCVCCEKLLNFDKFVEHAGIALRELKQRSRQFVYVVEREDESVLMPFNTFVPELETAAEKNSLKLFLDDLPVSTSCL